jgi:hypothetical protein
VLVIRLGSPGGKHIEAVHAERGALEARQVIAIHGRHALPLMLAQSGIFAHVIQEEINGRAGQAGAPLALGLVKADFDLPVFYGHLGDQKLPDSFI